MELERKKLLNIVWVFARIVLGGAIYAVGFQFFLYPNSIVTGGVTGIAMIINFLTGLPVGVLVIIMNIPLFFFALRRFGAGYLLGSLVGMLALSVMVDVLSLVEVNITSEPLLASIYGGVIMGFGLGLVYSAGGSTGGTDIAAKMLRVKYPFLNLGTLILILDVVVIVGFALIFGGYESAMYAMIAMFAATKISDLVLYGPDSSKICFIISDHSEDMRKAISDRLGRGVTLLYGRGAYSGKDKQIILCVIKRSQIAAIKRIARELDEHAFMIMSDSHEVYGMGFESIDTVK